MFSFFFTHTEPRDWASVKAADTSLFGRFFQEMLAAGIYIAPSQFEAGFLSTAHTDAVIDRTIEAVETAYKRL